MASLTVDKKKSYKSLNPINILSYNTSWEATQPAIDWNIGPYLFGPPNGKKGIGYLCGNRDLHDDVKRSGPFEIGTLKDGLINPCRENIFNLIKNGNYDLVGMQEYVHEWGGKSVFKDKMKKLEPKMKLIYETIMHKGINKEIGIGSIYNTYRFKKVGKHVKGDFKIMKKDYKTGKLMTNQDDGRPYLILLLKVKEINKYIIFINAHFPQPWSILMKENDKAQITSNEKANIISDELTRAVINLKKINNFDINYDIILTADTNDTNINYIDKLIIDGKKLYIGKNLKNTCCTSIVKDIITTSKGESKKGYDGKSKVKWEENEKFTRESERKRKGDVILFSGDDSFKYNYPIEKKDLPYSDHAPISTKLNIKYYDKNPFTTSYTESKLKELIKKNEKNINQRTTNNNRLSPPLNRENVIPLKYGKCGNCDTQINTTYGNHVMGSLGGIFCSPACKFMYYGELDTPYSGGKRRKTRKKRKYKKTKKYKKRKIHKRKSKKQRRGGSKKLTTKQKNKIAHVIKNKLAILGVNTNLHKLRKKLGGPRKFKSYTQKRQKKKRRVSKKK